jgi:histidinol-phosphatase (PHP family)
MALRGVLYDSHIHTYLCGHAEGTPDEYAVVAERRGLRGLVITCHNPVPDGWAASVRMVPEDFNRYLELVENARAKWAARVDIRLGLESDFMPGMETWLEHLHGSAPLDFILGSVHPQLFEYQQAFLGDDPLEFQQTYFTHLAEAAESGHFDCLAHPDVVKNVFPEAWRPREIVRVIRLSLDRIARTGVAMELNTSGRHKEISEMNPADFILSEMCQRGIPVVLGSDAHSPSRVGADFEQACDALQAAGYREVSFYLERKRHAVPLAAARASLKNAAEQ